MRTLMDSSIPADELRPTEVKFLRGQVSALEMDGAFSGYASLFGERDLSGDVVEPGAFARSVARRGPGAIKLLYQHDPTLPIGHFTEIREDARGLLVRGQLVPEVEKAREVLALMRAGALDGLSIGFNTVRARREHKTGSRHLLEVDLWEISVVTFPLLPEARISTVKSNNLSDPMARTVVNRIKEATRAIQSAQRSI